jgi:hypothetical protein
MKGRKDGKNRERNRGRKSGPQGEKWMLHLSDEMNRGRDRGRNEGRNGGR